MAPPESAAIARLEVQFQNLVEAGVKRDKLMERMASQIDMMEAKLDQSAGGIAVLRWIGLGSLGSAIAVTGAVFAWFKSL